MNKYSSFPEAVTALKEKYPESRYFNLKYRTYQDKVVSFQNFENPNNIHRELVEDGSVHEERLDDWLND